MSETGQRFAGGREDVRGEFGRARQTAQGISAGAEQRAGQLGQQTLQDLSARAEGRLGQLGQGYSELGQQATGRAAATGQDIGGRFDALRGQTAQGIRGAIDETGQAFGAGRADVTGGFQGAQAERAGRYDARTQQGLNMYDQMGQASMDRINRQFDEQIERTVGQMEQNLVSRGLDNTTIRGQIDRARSDIERNRQEAISQVESQVRQQKAGAFERFTSQGMSAQDAMQAAGFISWCSDDWPATRCTATTAWSWCTVRHRIRSGLESERENELLVEANRPDFKQDSLVWHSRLKDNRQSPQLNKLSDDKHWLDNLVQFNKALKHKWVF